MHPSWDAEEASLTVLDALVDHAVNVGVSTHLASRSTAFASHWVLQHVHSVAQFCASSDQRIETCLEDEPSAQPIDRQAIGRTAIRIQSEDPFVHGGPETVDPTVCTGGFQAAADTALRKFNGTVRVDDKAYQLFDIREIHHTSHTESEKGLLRHIEAMEREKELFRQQWEDNHRIEYYEVCETTDACVVIDCIPASTQKKRNSRQKTISSVAWRVKDCKRSRKNAASGRVPRCVVENADVTTNVIGAKPKLRRRPITTGRPNDTGTPRPSTAGAPFHNDGTLEERSTSAPRPFTASTLDGPRNVNSNQCNTERGMILPGLAESIAKRRFPVLEQFQAAASSAIVTLPCAHEVSPGVVVRTADGHEIRGSKVVQSSNTKESDFPPGGQHRRSVASINAAATPPTTKPPERRSPRIGPLFENDNREGASPHCARVGRVRWGLDGHKLLGPTESEWQVVMFTTESSQLPVPLEFGIGQSNC